MSDITMGSLFSGFGGFEVAAQWHGVKVLWQSEIEPWAVELLKVRFPEAIQLGDVQNIDGAKLPPVDIITFGSPCQDMSVAGNRAGLDGERSGLFREAIRIIREMREATNGVYPAFIVWENVPGAFTSHRGLDFKSVLEEITETEVPMPASGKWSGAGMVRGGKCDVAWRVLDAQYWGVPQRRKRIYLVGDYRGQCAAEVLFKPESVSRYPAPSREARKRIAAAFEESVGATDRSFIYDARGNGSGGICPTITGDHNGHISDYTGIVCIPIFSIDRAAFNQGEKAQYDFNIRDDGLMQTIVAKGPNAVGVLLKVFGVPLNFRPENTQLYEDVATTLCNGTNPGFHSGVVISADDMFYIVRRLTPSECAKSQGFPDDWHKGITNDKGKSLPDTAAYKGYGNAVATVCAEYPIANIVEILSKEDVA